MFYNDNNEQVNIEEATWKYVTIFDIDNEVTEQYRVEIIDGIDQEYVEEATEFDESDRERVPAGQPNGGQWVGDTSKSVAYKEKLEVGITPNEKIQSIQEKADNTITNKINNITKEMGIADKIEKVAMQGSYEKGTDLPSKGSDLDLFVVFKSDIPEEERNRLGLEIGLKTMTPEFASSQGWTDFRVDVKDATSKYAEAYFTIDGQEMEVQIVPTRHLTLDEIKNKEHNGEKISIGMERTPHQTEFMNKNLTPTQKKETRMLKKFMKETRLYDSSMKSQGFSGYSTEVLIHNFGTFEHAIDYFANQFKVGDVVGLPNDSNYTKEKYNKMNPNNKFHLIDPVDPNRDLISAFSDKKIARTILTAKALVKDGVPPTPSEPVEMNGVSIAIKSSENNPDTLSGQVQKLQKNIIDKLSEIGFTVDKEFINPKEITEGFMINPARTSIDGDDNNFNLNFGISKMKLDNREYIETANLGKMPEKAISGMLKGLDAKGTKYKKSEDGTTLSIFRQHPFENAQDAVVALINGKVGKTALEDSALLKEIRQNVNVFSKTSKFENLI